MTEVEEHYSNSNLSPTTGTLQSWTTVVKWLEDCQSDHADCFVPADPPWYPTRLLDVGVPGLDSIRLVLSAEAHLTGDYVTLSHCWGEVLHLKLTKDNVLQFMSGIELLQFPQTFQDAVEVTRRLRKRYIWIDALCIIQDDPDRTDWLHEAGLMHKVYSHSFLNIAATGALDSSRGLFMPRDADQELRPVNLSCSPPPIGTKEPAPVQNLIMTDFMFFNRELMNAPLHRRAWVLQERILAPRVLHFGSKQIFWECKRGLLCERFPDSMPDVLKKLSVNTFKSLDMLTLKPKSTRITFDQILNGPNGHVNILGLWGKVIEAYSQTHLTFKSDKVIALSGIAKRMRELFQDEYVAGMWRRCLESQLLWSVDDVGQVGGLPSTRSFTYRAPSWSWLSVDGKIRPGRYMQENLYIKVLDVTLAYQTEDTTGMILDGSLILGGRLRPLKIRPLELSGPSGKEVRVPGQWILKAGMKDLASSREDLPVWERHQVLVLLDVPHMDFEASNEADELFMMSAGGPWNTKDNPFARDDVDEWHEMLLLKCVDKKNAVFHRFGLVKFNTDQYPDVWQVVQEIDLNEAELPCIAYNAASHFHRIVLK